MSFFNSLSIRIPLAIIGGIFYGLLTYAIVLTLNIQAQTAIGTGILVFFLYLGSRLLILFSGLDTPYYSKGRKDSPYHNTPFYRTAQWVGTCYHHHDVFLLIFMVLLAIVFAISLIIDGFENRPFGQTIQEVWSKLTSLF